MFKVMFDTTEIPFREVRLECCIDLDLFAKFSGYSEVETYDNSLYDNEAEVERKIKEECSKIIRICLNDNWNLELSVCLKWNAYLKHMFDDELRKMGITAKTTICSMTLNEEDAKILKECINLSRSPREIAGWDHVYFYKPDSDTQSEGSEWICSKCNTTNYGKFCGNCGNPRES